MRSHNLLFAYAARIALPLAAASLAYLSAPPRALAVPEFPREIKRDLTLDYEPPCSICHLKNNTGVGTAGTAFVLALRDRGLDAESRSSLSAALTKLDDDKLDSDGDGESDVDELRAATDPNSNAPVSLKDAQPEWGCSLSLSRAEPADRRDVGGVLAFLAAAAAAFAARVQRRRHQRP